MILENIPYDMLFRINFFIIKCVLFHVFAIIMYGSNYAIKDVTFQN